MRARLLDSDIEHRTTRRRDVLWTKPLLIHGATASQPAEFATHRGDAEVWTTGHAGGGLWTTPSRLTLMS